MAADPLHRLVLQLRQTLLRGNEAGLTDAQLLECFVNRREQTALEILVRRHGPMVWGVCRRVLASHQDAEDAFQATLLVLVRKAASIRPREMVANWLYGVAHQTARKARATAAKRRQRERQVTEMPEPEAAEQDLWTDLQPLLDQELSRLPDKYRVAVVLCDLECKSRKEAARQLGVPEGTVASWLARARTMLAKRLARHGLAVPGGTLVAVLSQEASASVPATAVASTIKAITLVAAGQATAGLVSAKAAALMEGVLKAMFVNKIKALAVAALLLGMVAGGARLLAPYPAVGQQGQAERAPAKEKKADASTSRKEETPRKEVSDLEKLQGTWRAVSGEQHGVKLPDADLRAVVSQLLFTHHPEPLGYAVTWQRTGKDSSHVQFRINPNKTPREITFERTRKGIYELTDNTLKMCIYHPWRGFGDADYPARMDGKGPLLLLVFERVNPDYS
jgi:RNA polymerase sigma factor (sigma-70 family)